MYLEEVSRRNWYWFHWLCLYPSVLKQRRRSPVPQPLPVRSVINRLRLVIMESII
jgi:hypothetical protein